jgi:toxin FitB
MNYLIDTCCISELVKKSPDPNVVAWFGSVDESNMFISVITLGELHKGVEKLTDSDRKLLLHQWVSNDLPERFRNRVLPINLDVCQQWGKLQAQTEQKGTRIPAIDALIAATAIHHKLIVVTRNVDDFMHTGVGIVNPWV